MNRRSFIGVLGGGAMLPSMGLTQNSNHETTKPCIYLMETYYLRNGSQPARLRDYLSQTALPALAKVHNSPVVVLESLAASQMPHVVMILGFRSVEEFWGVRGKLNQDRELVKAFEAWQSGSEKAFESQENRLLEAASYSPEIAAPDPAPKSPRVFELRVYHTPSWRHLNGLHERFAGPEIKLFHKSGIHPILYATTVVGPDMPNLTYLTPFEDLAAREKAWDAFNADPEWLKARQESVEKHGQVVENTVVALYRAAAYSPVR